MASQQELAISPAPRVAIGTWLRLALGLLLCIVIAAAAIVASNYAPVVGAPVIAIALGVVVTNSLRAPMQISSLRIGEVSKLCLKGGNFSRQEILLRGCQGQFPGHSAQTFELVFLNAASRHRCANPCLVPSILHE